MRKKVYYLIFSLGIVFIIALFFTFFLHYYPLKHRNYIKKYAHEYQLESSLVAAVINAESGFSLHAISPSNAIGLMQLRLSTADEIASKLNDLEFNEEKLFSAQTNIKYGCFYLNYLIDYYHGNINNALCAYNAGLSNVNSWLKNEEYSHDGVNLSHIPFTETRNYIRKINSYKQIYKHFYNLK